MNTQQQTATVPTGFRVEVDTQGDDTITTIAGPSSGGVTTFIDERDGSVVLAVDGYDKDLSTGLDLTYEDARRLAPRSVRRGRASGRLAAPRGRADCPGAARAWQAGHRGRAGSACP